MPTNGADELSASSMTFFSNQVGLGGIAVAFHCFKADVVRRCEGGKVLEGECVRSRNN